MRESGVGNPPGTPYLSVDGAKMQRNILRMAEMAQKRGVDLRPHVKTHKIPAIARKQIEAGATGITVAKISEAEIMADGGIADIFVAYPLVTEEKIRRAIDLSKRVRLIAGVDSIEGARRLSAAAEAEDHVLEVRLEVDTGLRRTGIPYEKAVELARRIEALPWGRSGRCADSRTRKGGSRGGASYGLPGKQNEGARRKSGPR
jgi:D-serine deaminase-like pyridoxal phosphate-dependent protein